MDSPPPRWLVMLLTIILRLLTHKTTTAWRLPRPDTESTLTDPTIPT